MADLGEDFAGILDIQPDLGRSMGRKAYLESVVRRYVQPRGGIFYDRNYGYDIRDLLSAGVRTRAAQQSMESQALADERTESASVSFMFDEAAKVINARVELDDGDGPFTLVATPGDLTFELLEAG